MRALVAALTVLGAPSGCSRSAPPQAPSPAPRPDVVLVSIDTLRADRLGIGVTPVMDALAARGSAFTSARTVAPLTLPAHVSLMTGVRPPTHGVHLNGVERFDGRVPTLAKRFGAAGYRTAAFVGAYVLDRRFGLAEGFDTYDDQIPRSTSATARLEAERKGEVVVDRAVAWLRTQPPATRIFLWVHLYDPHAPYTPPPDALARAHGKPYEGEVAYADAQVGRLIAAVRAAGRDPLLVIVGDHGESLGEHGEPTHGMLLYEPAIRVPLVWSGPGVLPGVRADPVSILDVAPTILARAGLAPIPGVEGRDVYGQTPADSARGLAAYAETEYPRLAAWSPLASVTDGRWKLIDGVRPELYDVTRDPAEQRNVAPTLPAVVESLRNRLVAMQHGESQTRSPGSVSPEVARRLRALGYVAGPVGATSETAASPVDMMPAWSDFESAVAALSGPDRDAALERLAAVARAHPDAPVFQTTLAAALVDRGRAREALDIYRRAVQRWPGDSLLFHDLAVSARAAGSADEAVRAERAALAIDDRNSLAHNGLGLLLVDANKPQEAAASFQRALDLDPTNPQLAANLGNAWRASGDRDAAERAFRRALEIDRDWPDALNGLAVLLVQAGRPAEAIDLLNRALARDPGLVEARLNLGIAAQEAGNIALAREAYRAVLRAPARFARERHAATMLLSRLPGKS